MKLLTLIIPTYNRPDFLKRILGYYNGYNLDAKIIVADSSDMQNKKINKQIIQLFPNLDILYLNTFSPKLVSHHKFAKMVEYVKTKYCVFCADDDFIVPGGIKIAIDFLEKNSDYASTHGTYSSFYVHTNLLGKKKLWWKYIYPFESITNSKAEDRLASHLIRYEQVLYSVRRTDITKICYRELVRSKVNPLFFGELLPDMLTLVYGKMKKIRALYSARQAFSSVYNYWPTLQDAMKTDVYDNEYSKFITCIISNLLKKSTISKEKAQEIVDDSMVIYLRSSIQQHFLGKVLLVMKSFPDFVSKELKLLHARYLFSKDKKDRIGPIDNPTTEFLKDFDNIRKAVLEQTINQ